MAKKAKRVYLDIERVKALSMVFNVIIGNRGSGKSYTTIKDCVDNNLPFIYLRRTDTEVKFLANSTADMTLNPVSDVCLHEKGYIPDYKKLSDGILTISDPDGKKLGMIIALSTFSTKRGFEYEECKVIIFDECVPENHVRLFKKEDEAFFNFYESINRNREFNEGLPITVYMLCNSNNLAHPLLQTLKLDKMYTKMRKRGKNYIYDKDRSLLLYEQACPEFIDEKKKTALYRLTKGTQFYGMALENEFVYDDMSNVVSKDIKPYSLLVSHELIDVWVHKSDRTYYITEHKNGVPQLFNKDADNIQLCDKLRRVYGAYVKNDVYFETFKAKIDFLNLV